MANLSAATIAAIREAVAEAIASQPARPKAAGPRVTIAALREAGTFDCGVTGHGKANDGHFATLNGATYHAKRCAKMAAVLAAR